MPVAPSKIARDRAITRLIETHRDEYEEMLADAAGRVRAGCVICGTKHRRPYTTCSPWCTETWRLLRQHIGEHRDAQRLKNARVRIAHAPTKAERALRAAQYERLKNGTAEYHGRWLVVGSETYDRAMECAERGLPIVKKLPKPIQQQLADALSC